MKLPYTGIIDNTLVEHTRKTLSGGETLSYYIDNTIGWNSLERYHLGNLVTSKEIATYNTGHDHSKTNFINDIFSRLDLIIDIDFFEMNHNNGSMIDIYHISYASNFADNTVGQAIAQESIQGSWWDILWKDSPINYLNSENSDKNTLVHEIGHSLGLAHPFNDPTNELYNSKDTIMSYNQGPDGWNTWFSETDINALISIWGRENDFGTINFSNDRKEYKYQKTAEDIYYIKTEIGIEDITNINTLIFADQSIQVKKDVIGVFDLIKEKKDITGKIYRLYNASFGRFPDHDGLKYWIDNNQNGTDTYRKTSKSFILSNEFNNLYGNEVSNSEYTTRLYLNILGRNPDKEGYNYWLNQLEKGFEDRSEVLMGFSESIENQTIFSTETSIF